MLNLLKCKKGGIIMSMFCFQCEQTAKGQGCTVCGVCGKKEDRANLLDEVIISLI